MTRAVAVAVAVAVAAASQWVQSGGGPLPLAVAAHHACEFVGLPEAEYALAHATLHIACAPKSNSVMLGLAAAKHALNSQPVQSVPMPMRDKGGKANKLLGHGKGYLYAHDYPENIAPQSALEKPLTLFTPKTASAITLTNTGDWSSDGALPILA